MFFQYQFFIISKHPTNIILLLFKQNFISSHVPTTAGFSRTMKPYTPMNTRPSITISLSPLLQSYCRFVFNSDPNEKEIRLRRNHDIAKLIHSNVIAWDRSMVRPFNADSITFILALDNINETALRYHFLHVSRWGEQKITEGIEYEFRHWIKNCFDRGYEKGYQQKVIIEAILRGLNDRNNSANFDMIKKIDYRYRRKVEETRFNELLKECQIFEYQ